MPGSNSAPGLLLFDIDGTLLLGRGIPRQAFLEVIQKRYPDFPNDHSIRFSGMTDPRIVHQLLSTNGFASEVNETLIREIIEDFIILLQQRMTPQNPPELLPGVKTLLDYCTDNPECYLGLVTGNVMQGARIKLSAAGLYSYFQVGAFGSDHADRNLLPPLAVKRASLYFNREFDKNRTWIIGDSVNDIVCARVNQIRCLAVPTGFTTWEELWKEHPDELIPDLTDLNRVTSILGI